jgi:hypothetical protein
MDITSAPSQPGATWKRRRAAIARAVAAVVVAGGVAVPVALTDNATASATTTCPTGALAFTTDLSNGTLQIGALAKSTGNSAHACGSIAATSSGLQATVLQSNITFAPGSTTVLILRLPTTTQALGNLSGPASIASDGTHVALTGPVQATANLLGAQCVIGPITPTLTTDKSGALTGKPFVADSTGAMHGKVVANNFTVPAIKATRSCPFLIAGLTNAILGLPLRAGQSSISFDATLHLGT